MRPVPETLDWDAWESSGYEYERFSSSAYDLALTGPYQFVLRDAWLSVAPDGDAQNQLAAIDEFFSARAAHQDNAMTGLLAGKNLILVQLESIDDFVLNEQNTPTLARLQSEGINFSEFYTPQYSNGYNLQHRVCCADRGLSLCQRQCCLFAQPQRVPGRDGQLVRGRGLHRELLP